MNGRTAKFGVKSTSQQIGIVSFNAKVFTEKGKIYMFSITLFLRVTCSRLMMKFMLFPSVYVANFT
jgi:hypothetical protein